MGRNLRAAQNAQLFENEMIALDDTFGGSAVLALWALRWAAGIATDFEYREAIAHFQQKLLDKSAK